jgi:hypothetical protein
MIDEMTKKDILEKAQELNLWPAYNNEFAQSSASAYNTWAGYPANDGEAAEPDANGCLPEVPIHDVKVEDLGQEWIAGIVWHMRWSALREEDGSGCLYGYATRRELIDHARRLEEFGIWRYGLDDFPVYNYTHWRDGGVLSVSAREMTPEKVAAHIDDILDPKPHPMNAKDRKAVASLLLPAFNALVKARDRAGSRYEPLHEEIAEICDDVLVLMLDMYDPDFEQDSVAKISYPVSRLSDDRNRDAGDPPWEIHEGSPASLDELKSWIQTNT